MYHNLVDTVALLNPDIENDPTYLYGTKRIDYIFTTPLLAETSIKGEQHQFHQYIVGDHKGVHIYFKVPDLSDTSTMGKIHAVYRRLPIGRRGIVKK